MTASAHEFSESKSGLLARLGRSISRSEFFAGLYILGCANGLLGRFILTANLEGWTGAILGLDMNAIVLFACFAGITLMLSGERDEIRSADLGVAAVFLALVTLPIFALSWVAVTGLSFYILLFAAHGSDRRRGAVVLLALTVPLLWSRLLFQFLAPLLLAIDAGFVAWLLGTDRVGNTVRFADSSGYLIVSPACTSFANISIAFLCWVSLTQWAKHRWSSSDILWLLLACTSVVALNVTRMAVTGLSYRHYEAIHNQWGDAVISTVMLCLVVGICMLGARRDLFSRA